MAITDVQSPQPRIEITREMIDQAIPGDSGHCAIADAISAQVPEASGVTVDLATVQWTDRAKGVRYVWLTPVWAQQFLLSFDRGVPLDQWIKKFRFGPAAQIVEVKASSKKTAAERAARRQELEVKETAGEELTPQERRSLTGFRAQKAAMGGSNIEDRPTSEGPASLAHVQNEGKQAVRVGGKTPGRAVLRHGLGRRRQYGVRVAGVPDVLLDSERS